MPIATSDVAAGYGAPIDVLGLAQLAKSVGERPFKACREAIRIIDVGPTWLTAEALSARIADLQRRTQQVGAAT